MYPSVLQEHRKAYHPAVPPLLKKLNQLTFINSQDPPFQNPYFKHLGLQSSLVGVAGEAKHYEPLRLGVFFSGGQASGGHNVITAIFDALFELNAESRLFGFLEGPSGLVNGRYQELSAGALEEFRNQGGFDLIGSGRTKIETPEQLEAALKNAIELQLDGLIVIGGDDSNTNAAILADFFLSKGCKTRVIGIPKTIDGDLKSEDIEISFGFDTACKVYSELIGNIERDCLSAKKYYHFIKLMGRSASHIALECALLTQPNFTLISEEVLAKKQTLQMIVQELCDMIIARAHQNKHYGVILIPEGLIEFIPEFKELIKELSSLNVSDLGKLTPESAKCFQSLPSDIQEELLMERDPHGNIQVSLIETERLLLLMVKKELKKRTDYTGKFAAIHHFFGYEGRAAYPSNFDSTYCYSLGKMAVSLIAQEHTGYIACIQNLAKGVDHWQLKAIPIISIIHLELRHGKQKPVIKKALVELLGKPFAYFASKRDAWQLQDCYRYPGPIQFSGDSKLTDLAPMTLYLEKSPIEL